MGDCTQLLLYASQANLELGNTTVPCSAPEGLFLTNSFTSKVQLMLPLSRGGLVQTDAGLSWEITTYDTASQQRPEPDSINAFSHLHSWEAGGINLFQNVLLVVVSQKQISFTLF